MRDFCSNCDFLKMRCICHYISQIKNQTPIIVIRYPKEALHPFNTINLAKHNFKNLKVFDTEFVDNLDELKAVFKYSKNPVLLLPTNKSIPLNNENFQLLKIDCILILDGTWKKAKKIYYQSQFLQSIPSVHLEDHAAGQYLIRKSNFNGGVSSIEAIVESLKIIEPSLNLEKALDSFKFMNQNQLKFNPSNQ